MIDEIWITRPQRRSFMPGTSARVRTMQLVKFISTSRSQSASRISSICCTTLLPALFTRMSTLPRVFTAASASRTASWRRFMSATRCSTRAPVCSVDLAGGGGQGVFVAAADHHLGPGLGEERGDGAADAFAAAGDEGRAAGEIEDR